MSVYTVHPKEGMAAKSKRSLLSWLGGFDKPEVKWSVTVKDWKFHGEQGVWSGPLWSIEEIFWKEDEMTTHFSSEQLLRIDYDIKYLEAIQKMGRGHSVNTLHPWHAVDDASFAMDFNTFYISALWLCNSLKAAGPLLWVCRHLRLVADWMELTGRFITGWGHWDTTLCVWVRVNNTDKVL